MAKPKRHYDEQQAEARRQQVLNAAENCFLQRGFHNASMAEISAASGMSVGHIYHYFSGKEAIIGALAERECAGLFRMVREAATSLETFVGALQELTRRHVLEENDERHMALICDIMAEMGRNERITKDVRGLDRRMRLQMLELCARFKPEWPAEKAGAVVELVTLLMTGYGCRKAVSPDMSQEGYISEACRTIAFLFS